MTSTQVHGKQNEPAEPTDESVIRLEGEYRGGWWYQMDWHTTDNRIEIVVATTTTSKHLIDETLLHLDVPAADAATVWKAPFEFLKYEKR